ncbi:MAG: peptide chain release factor-like protein [Alphaproteobacteria bacterium]|nr:peptide chain release factor-like protein [Alphaproteobacteria bacterium]
MVAVEQDRPHEPHARDRASLERICAVQFVRASGPGGQHRNKRETGVRLTHPPSGVVVQATERRSQSMNLDVAYQRMASALAERAHVKKPRKATRPSAACKQRRLQAKRQRSELKAQRRQPDRD